MSRTTDYRDDADEEEVINIRYPVKQVISIGYPVKQVIMRFQGVYSFRWYR